MNESHMTRSISFIERETFTKIVRGRRKRWARIRKQGFWLLILVSHCGPGRAAWCLPLTFSSCEMGVITSLPSPCHAELMSVKSVASAPAGRCWEVSDTETLTAVRKGTWVYRVLAGSPSAGTELRASGSGVDALPAPSSELPARSPTAAALLPSALKICA